MADRQLSLMARCHCCNLMDTTRFYAHRRTCSLCAHFCPIGGPCAIRKMLDEDTRDEMTQKLVDALTLEDLRNP